MKLWFGSFFSVYKSNQVVQMVQRAEQVFFYSCYYFFRNQNSIICQKWHSKQSLLHDSSITKTRGHFSLNRCRHLQPDGSRRRKASSLFQPSCAEKQVLKPSQNSSVVQCAPLYLQISMKEHLEDNLLQCTMQDLLRYDDYNNDGHLSLHEFYTAFRE